MQHIITVIFKEEISDSVVECKSCDRGVAGLSLNRGAVLSL